MRFISAVICALLLIHPCGAVEKTPLDISAESLELEQEKGYAVFEGDVKVAHDGLKLAAQKLEVFYASKGNKSEEQRNSVGSSAIKQIVAIGEVTVVYGEDTATGDKVIYDPANGLVKLLGRVVMVRDGNTMRGEELFYDTKTKRLQLKSKKTNGRVKATFSMKEETLQ